ncbi:MAG: NAD(P)-dependent oxidoreductase [Ruminococcus sp.]|nr:NAD(P)-dependent oxidoreductase [Ruminococcus sp.]
MNSVLREDILSVIGDTGIPWDMLEGKTVFITGAAGLIGSVLAKSLLSLENRSVKVVAMARSREKAERVFADFSGNDRLEICEGDINSGISYPGGVHYIIHGASVTSSKMMAERPVDVIMTAVGGTANVLEFARKKNAERTIFLSSMEIYGIPGTDEKIYEDSYKYLDHMNVRSSYPESKRLAETLCVSYAKQYGLAVGIVRLTQTFGAGAEFGDGRAFADFARNAVTGKNIILRTKGETKRNYLYTADAARAVLYVMLKGACGEAYNAANENTYCTVYRMAQTAAELGKGCCVEIQESEISEFGYAPPLKMNLSAEKLRSLGWEAKYDLKEMFERMMRYWKEEGAYEA